MSKYMYVEDDGSVVFGAGTNVGLGPAYMLATSVDSNAGFTANRDNSIHYASFDLIESGSTSTGWSIQMQPNDSNLSIYDRINGNNIIYITKGGPVKINSDLAVTGNISASSFTGTITNAITSSQGLKAWGFLTLPGTASVLTKTTYNCSVNRINSGSYGVTFTNQPSSPNYAVVITAMTIASNQNIPSIGYSSNHKTNSFTMSFKSFDSATNPIADFVTASFHVSSY